MSNVKVVLNRQGVKDMLKSDEMMAICKEYADGVAERAGDGYEVSTYNGRTRVNAQIAPKTVQAIRDNMKNNTLLKAVK